MASLDIASDRDSRQPLALRWVVPILLLLAFATFWPVLRSQFASWDDSEQLEVNQYLLPPSFEGLGKRWAGPYMNIYIPFTHTLWFVVAWLGGENPDAPVRALKAWPFKLTNLLLHVATSTVVYCVLRKLFSARWLPLLGAALYCLHPVQVEAIAWASGAKDLLLGFFGVLCVCFYLGDHRRGFHLSPRSYGLAVAAMVLACLSKPTALVLPAMLTVVDLMIVRRGTRELVTRLLPFAIVGVACAVYARVVQPVADFGVQPSLTDRLLIPFHSLAFYVFKLFWPTQLAFDYGMNWHALLGSARLYIAWIVPVAIAVIAFALRRKMPLLAAGLLLAIIPIAPVSGIVFFDFSYYSITADHYLYLPMLGVSIAVVAILAHLPGRAVFIVSPVVLAALGMLSCRQSHVWRTQRGAVEHTLRVNPKSASSYSVLAILEVEGSGGDPAKLSLAESYARKAVEMRPDHPRSLNMLANVLSAQGRYEEALAEIDRALVLAPNDPQYHLAKAGILGELHRGEEAIQELRVVLRYNPDHRLALQLVEKWDRTVRTTVQPSKNNATRPSID